MEYKSKPSIRTGSGADLAFGVVVLASYFIIFSSMRTTDSLHILGLTILGVIYIWNGIYGYATVSTKPKIGHLVVYFLTQMFFGGAIIYLSQGVVFNALVLLPLTAHSVLLLNPRSMYLTNLGIAVVYLLAVFVSSWNWSSVSNAIPFFIAGQVFIVAFTQMAVGEERARIEVEKLVSELENANQQLRDYAVQVEELAISRERNRLAREIHDGVGHYLTTVNMQLQAAEAVFNNDPKMALKLVDIAQKQTQEALGDIRQSVSALRDSSESSIPLPERLKKLLLNLQMSGVETDLDIVGDLRVISPQADLTIFRAAQEGTNNAIRHGNATRICVRLDYSRPGEVQLSVEDNGMGVDHAKEGHGLIGLQERVNLIRGRMATESKIGNGFALHIWVPG